MKKFFDIARPYLAITLGMLLYAFSATAFQVPNKIVGGGATGVSTVIYYLSNQTIPVFAGFLGINAILIIIALKVLGPKFGVKTIYAIGVGSFLLAVMQPLFPVGLVSDRFMASVISGILTGTGIGIAISYGGSTGGTDIVAMIINKYRNISPGKLIMYSDCLVIASGFLINSNIEGLMYGYVMMGVVSFTVDFVLTGKKQSAQLFIFSDKYAEVADVISKDLGRGVTVADCQGWYTGQNRKMLIVVVRKQEASEVLKVTKRVDKDAFMTMNTVMGVFGKGFEEMK